MKKKKTDSLHGEVSLDVYIKYLLFPQSTRDTTVSLRWMGFQICLYTSTTLRAGFFQWYQFHSK